MLILEIGFAIASIVIVGITIFAVVCMLRDWIMAEIAFTIFGTISITLVAIFAFVPLLKDCKKK